MSSSGTCSRALGIGLVLSLIGVSSICGAHNWGVNSLSQPCMLYWAGGSGRVGTGVSNCSMHASEPPSSSGGWVWCGRIGDSSGKRLHSWRLTWYANASSWLPLNLRISHQSPSFTEIRWWSRALSLLRLLCKYTRSPTWIWTSGGQCPWGALLCCCMGVCKDACHVWIWALGHCSWVIAGEWTGFFVSTAHITTMRALQAGNDEC